MGISLFKDASLLKSLWRSHHFFQRYESIGNINIRNKHYLWPLGPCHLPLPRPNTSKFFQILLLSAAEKKPSAGRETHSTHMHTQSFKNLPHKRYRVSTLKPGSVLHSGIRQVFEASRVHVHTVCLTTSRRFLFCGRQQKNATTDRVALKTRSSRAQRRTLTPSGGIRRV